MNSQSIVRHDVAKAEGLHKQFQKGNEDIIALNNVSFNIRSYDFIAISGPSGGGKSTLLNILGCLDKPDRGNLFIGGQNTSEVSTETLAHIRRDNIGFIFQDYNLIDQFTLLENVMLPLLYRGTNKQDAKETATKCLKQVDLSSRADHLPSELSGGQQQRGAIARALSYAPPLILADEPTGALDPKSSETVMETLKQLAHAGHAVVIVSHDNALVQTVPIQYQIDAGTLELIRH